MRIAILLLCLFVPNAMASDWIWELDEQMHRLGKFGDAEWDDFKQNPATAPSFNSYIPVAEPNRIEWTLFVRQRDVKQVWPVMFKGATVTNLFLSEDDLVDAFPIRAGMLTNPVTSWAIRSPGVKDDIEVGEFRLDQRPLRVALADGRVNLRVTEAGAPIPCRVTVVDKNGSLFPVLTDATNAAVRPGVVYLGQGAGIIKLARGDYTIFVGRGFEYSVSTNHVTITPGTHIDLNVELRREVDTRGFVASDTHVHTFTYSRHGDATDEERAITLAGEGIELPISTDHNLIMDPVTPAKNTGMDRFYTPVYGDEVTTGHAHFNIFPLRPGSKAPNWKIDDWPELMKEMRAAPGVKVVILNHPRNIHNHFQPFASTNFNAKTGENLRGFKFTFDAVEVVNSSALQSDWMINFRDWMALLNYGYRVTGVGSSDCHDVSRYIVGQGRTYTACDDSDPAHIDVDRACDSLLKNRALISMGLLANIEVDGKFLVGDLATNLDKNVRVLVSVQGPGWTAVDRVELYANGELLREEHFSPIYKAGVKKQIEWKIVKPRSDVYLLAIASGPGVTAPFWRIPKPYQPTSTTWNPRVIGATNPVWLDADGDGRFTALRLQNQKK
jgi:hypothetical protein